MKRIKLAAVFLLGIIIFGEDLICVENDIPALKDVFKNYFLIGSGAVRPGKYFNDKYYDFIIKHYSALNINTFYPAMIHPKDGVYKWEDSDKTVEFALKNNIRIRGHVLVWQKEGIGAQWLLKDKSGNPLSRKAALENLKEHIQTVVSRYKGKVRAWDVVNEAIDVKEPDNIKSCMLKDVIESDYIEKAFIFAHESDPDAKLFYNDFNECNVKKREAIYNLLKSLLDKHIPVHGVGMQMHVGLEEPQIAEIEKTIELYSKLGLDIHITELDIDMNPKENLTVFTEEMKRQQAQRYKELFDVFKKNFKVIKAVFTWGIDDSGTWLKTNRKNKRENWPLLFDENLKPKPAFWAIVKE